MGMGLDMSDEEVEEQTDDDIWQQLEGLTTYASPNQTMARELICRLRVRPRFVRRDGAVLSVSQQADMRRLTMMYELWTGESPPSLHAERVTTFDRMLRQIRASREHRSPVRSAARQHPRNVARSNRSLLSGAIPSVPTVMTSEGYALEIRSGLHTTAHRSHVDAVHVMLCCFLRRSCENVAACMVGIVAGVDKWRSDR